MSFWRTFGFHTISPIENILDRENFTLEELLDEDDILQETKAQNKKLLDFLAKPDTLQQLFNYVLVEAEESAEAKRRFKYPFICSEILCADVWSLGEVIFEQEALVPKLLAFFDREGRLSPVSTGHVCKVIASLLQRKTGEMLTHMKKKEDLIGKLLNHLDSGAVMDLLLKIISCEDPAANSGGAAPTASATLQWLADSALIPRLVARLDVAAPADLQDNVSSALIDIVNASSSLPNSPLMTQLHSEEVFNKLLAYSLSERSTHYGLNLIVELLNRAAQDTHNATAQLADVPAYLRVLLGALDKYLALLAPAADAKTVTFSFGAIVPLGFVRLKVVELVAALLRLNYKCVSAALAALSAPAAVLSLFFTYKWNNFLHATVRALVSSVLAGEDQELRMHLVVACKLGARLIDTVKANAEEEARHKGVRSGLMGFVIGMATDLANAAHNNAALAQALKEDGTWATFEDGALKELKNAEEEPLGGSKPPMHEQIEDEPESGEIVLKYLVQQGFSTKGMSFAQEVQEEDDDEDDEDERQNGRGASDEYLARAMYQTSDARGDRGDRGDGSGSSSDEDDEDEDDENDADTQPRP